MRLPYAVAMEIAGPAAMFTRPDTGGSFVSYPAPTWSAAKGMFESIARFRTARRSGCMSCSQVRDLPQGIPDVALGHYYG